MNNEDSHQAGTSRQMVPGLVQKLTTPPGILVFHLFAGPSCFKMSLLSLIMTDVTQALSFLLLLGRTRRVAGALDTCLADVATEPVLDGGVLAVSLNTSQLAWTSVYKSVQEVEYFPALEQW